MTEFRVNQLARFVLRWATGLYPPEKRAWGEAILGEIGSVGNPGAVVSWTAGGLMVALRSYFSHLFSKLFRRREASGEPVFTGPASAPPPVRWKLAVVCLAIFAALLFVPEMRQILSVVAFNGKTCLKGDFPQPVETAPWEKIGREAEARGDAATMAFAAMRLPDGSAHIEEAVDLAKHAVAKDSNLTWIYYFLTQPIWDKNPRRTPHPELLEDLRKWDPNNAAPYLAAADDAAFSRNESLPRPPANLKGEEKALADAERLGPQWREWMDRASAAPNYDDYTSRRLDLDRRVMQEHGIAINEPIVMAGDVGGLRIPNLRYLEIHSELHLAQGAEAERAGRLEEAASQYWSVAHFGQRIQLSSGSDQWDIVNLIAYELERSSFERLQPVLQKMGRAQEAEVIASVAQEERNEFNSFRSERARTYNFLGSNALWVHVWSLLATLSIVLLVITLLTFAVKRSPSRLVHFALSYLPVLLVTSCAGLLVAYRPYAKAFRSFMDNPSEGHRFSDDFISLYEMPHTYHLWVWAHGRMLFLWAVIAAGGTMCLWLVSRTVRRRHA